MDIYFGCVRLFILDLALLHPILYFIPDSRATKTERQDTDSPRQEPQHLIGVAHLAISHRSISSHLTSQFAVNGHARLHNAINC